jgi:hypothetical protein
VHHSKPVSPYTYNLYSYSKPIYQYIWEKQKDPFYASWGIKNSIASIMISSFHFLFSRSMMCLTGNPCLDQLNWIHNTKKNFHESNDYSKLPSSCHPIYSWQVTFGDSSKFQLPADSAPSKLWWSHICVDFLRHSITIPYNLSIAISWLTNIYIYEHQTRHWHRHLYTLHTLKKMEFTDGLTIMEIKIFWWTNNHGN